MRQIPVARVYLIASAKVQVVAAEQLLREAVSNMQIAEAAGADDVGVKALRAVVALRKKVLQVLEETP